MLGHEWIADELRGIHETFWLPLLPQPFRTQWTDLDLWERSVLRWAVYVVKAREASVFEDRYLEVSYEYICCSPVDSLTKIFNFLVLNSPSLVSEQSDMVSSSSAYKWKENPLSNRHEAFYQKVLHNFDLIFPEQ